MTRPEMHRLEDAAGIPNSLLPVVLLTMISLKAPTRPETARNSLRAMAGWAPGWTGSTPSTTSTPPRTRCSASSPAPPRSSSAAPRGAASRLDGGEDVVAWPAGTGHCNAGSSGDLLVVGAYLWDRDALGLAPR